MLSLSIKKLSLIAGEKFHMKLLAPDFKSISGLPKFLGYRKYNNYLIIEGVPAQLGKHRIVIEAKSGIYEMELVVGLE